MQVSSEDPELGQTGVERPVPPPGGGPRQRGQSFHGWMRVRRARDFERVYRRGGRARGRFVTVAVAPNDLDCTRLGLSIGKRVFRRAVPRNRVRRLVREAFRLGYPDLPHGVDIVVIGSEPAVAPPLDELRAELVRLAAEAVERRRRRRAGRGGRP